MKKLLFFIITVLFFSFGGSVFAENATNLSIITDKEELFSANEKDTIKQASKVGDIQFYVFTISSLDGRNENDVARTLFNEESLGKNDALLLLSAKEHKIAFTRYPDSAFDQKVDAYGGKNLLDEAFVPYAKENDYTGGILSVFEEVNDQILHNEVPKQEIADSDGTSGSESIVAFLAMVGKVVGIIILSIVGVFILFSMIKKLRKRNQTVSKMNDLTSLSTQLSQRIQTLETDLEPYRLYTGDTQTTISHIRTRLEQYQTKNEDIQTWINKNKISFFSPTKHTKMIKHKKDEVKEYISSLTRVEKEIQTLHQVEQELQTAIEQAKRSFTSAKDSFKKTQETQRFSFEQMEKTVNNLQELLNDVENGTSLDPILTKRNMKKVVDTASTLQKDLAELPEIIHFIDHDLKKSIQITIDKVASIQQDEQLLFAEQHPSRHIEKAQKVAEEAVEFFSTGHLEQAKMLFGKFNELLVGAIQLAMQMVEKRKENVDLIQEAESLYTTIPLTLEQDISLISHKIREEFGTTQTKKLNNQIHSLSTALKEAFQFIETAKKYQHANTQKYLEANELLTRVVRSLRSMVKEYQTCMDAYDRLVRQKNNLSSKQTSYTRRVNQAVQKANYHYLQSSLFQHTQQQLLKEIEEYGTLFTHTPVSLDEIEKRGTAIEKNLDQFDKMIQKMISDKHVAELKARQLKDSYSSTYNRTRRHHRSSYTPSYPSSQMDSLIAQGMYTEAISHMEQAERDMDNMEREHKRALDEERRAEQERQDNERRRQQEEDNRRNNSYSDNGSNSSGWGDTSNDSSPGSDSTSW